VARYVAPEEFARWKAVALDLGFADAESGPLVRSSFHAHKLYDTLTRIPRSVAHAVSDLQ
jgi:lipoic acid synthetase